MIIESIHVLFNDRQSNRAGERKGMWVNTEKVLNVHIFEFSITVLRTTEFHLAGKGITLLAVVINDD